MHQPLNILVIEDSEDDRLFYRRMLRKIGEAQYAPVEAEDGEEGLRLLSQAQPGCVLLDYSLPGRSGIEVLKRIRSRHPFVPVVMLTGQGSESIAVAAMQEGAQNYIAKAQITPESLQRVIRVAIEHCALHQRIHEQRSSLEIFTRALAHDLKEPVRTIRSFLDLLAREEVLSERTQHYFHYINNAAERMSTLIDTVYFYTRLEGGQQQQLAQERCNVASVLEDVKENLSELIRERQAVITCAAQPEIYINRMQLIQVLQNLICNAIRHCESTPIIHLHAEEGVEQWLLRISDNGPGIQAEHHEKIFQPFKRVSHRKEQGLGLGLAICKKIVESYGGKIWYESRAEAGATFLFTVPKIPAPDDTGETSSQAPAVASRGGALASLLLVDDSDADIELSKIMLIEDAHLHCNLLLARSAQEALEHLRTTPVDLMLLDINMPGMDGFELLQAMRAQESLRAVPVVMCTTSSYDKDMEQARALGVAGYLHKPAEFGRLKPIIEHTAGLQLRQESGGQTLLRVA